MRVLIVSDTHRHNENLEKVLENIGSLDMVIHCGDAEGSEDGIRYALDCPMYIVAGNNDFFTSLSSLTFLFSLTQYTFYTTFLFCMQTTISF